MFFPWFYFSPHKLTSLHFTEKICNFTALPWIPTLSTSKIFLIYFCSHFSTSQFSSRWSAKQCIERHYFICQHRMSFVNEKNRYKIYTKWNETYPNQLANEVVVFVSTTGNRRWVLKLTKKKFFFSAHSWNKYFRLRS